MNDHRRLAATLAFLAFAGAAHAAPDCGDDAIGFDQWLPNMEREAVAAGVAPSVARAALGSAIYDASVIAHDRRQGSFQGDFAAFAATRVTAYRVKRGKAMMIAYGEPLDAIETKYGVPAPF